MRKYRKFFDNKQCRYCKCVGTTLRFYKNKSQVICDKKSCDYKSRVDLGIFIIGINIKG